MYSKHRKTKFTHQRKIKKRLKMKKLLYAIAVSATIFTGCSKDEDEILQLTEHWLLVIIR
jgi:uncharacterized lipoprotein YajG